MGKRFEIVEVDENEGCFAAVGKLVFWGVVVVVLIGMCNGGM